MSIRVETHFPQESVAVIVPTGDLDVQTAPRLREAVRDAIEQGAVRLVIDLRAVDHVDSTALGVLISTMRRATEQGGGLKIVTDNVRIRRIFELTGLTRVFELCGTEEEALAGTGAA